MAGLGTPKRLSYGAVAAGIGGVVLIISLFLSWYSSGGFSQSGWESFNFADIVLFVLALLAIAYALIEFTATVVALPVGRERALTVIGIIATTLSLAFLIEGSSDAFGVVLASLASIAILVGGFLAEQRPELSVALGGGRAAPTEQMTPAGGGGYAAPPVQTAPPPAAAPPPVAAAPAQPPAPQPVAPPPPGGTADWYPDPHGVKRLRYFDGANWTEHTAD